MNRIGFGYDSHRFAPGRPLVLGGVRIEHELGLAGHSDADAVLHALTDAILGAVGEGDIGELFPDTDPQWKDADSRQFLSAAVERARAAGYVVANADLTIVTESPRLKAHKPAMRDAIADLLGVEASRVNVKAKTNERMGWIGRGEGVAAIAAVMMSKDREHE
jgi:2-C-methyl-D-erythritol 2,4-cyclodiphosphate synthase